MRWALAPAVALVVLVVAARAAHAARPRFEPTDLELEEPGTLDLDLQLGPADGQSAWRLVVPDFELDLGILPELELDLDGAWAWEGGASSDLFDHTSPDNLWLSVKLGLGDWRSEDEKSVWALGLQIGPKLPSAPGTSGVGVEGLVLLGRYVDRTHLVLNVGGFVDPDAGMGRPRAVEGGLDLDLDLDADGTFSLSGELGGTYYFSSDPHEASATAGITWAATPMLDLSVVALVGLASGSDHFAVFFGISPKFKLWGPPPK
jgi:hypothetical protein